MTIERDFDVPFVAGMALREKQIQQNYRPVIAVHKWFARRPGTLFRALLLAEFGSGPLQEKFFEANSLKGIRVADPFMGGGTPLLEANRLGCDVVGFDINPMAHWVVRREIEWLGLTAYREAAVELTQTLEHEIGHLYRTRCLRCRSARATVKYFLWVKTTTCVNCNREVNLFPGYLLSQDRRHPLNVLICPKCGELAEVHDRKRPGDCDSCGSPLAVQGPAKAGHCPCPWCKFDNRYPIAHTGAPRHRLFAIEYRCPACRKGHRGRFFKKPDVEDMAKLEEARSLWRHTTPLFVPDDPIPTGDETNRLHRWGYRFYRDMFNERQLLGLETSARFLMKMPEGRVRNALATNLSDLLRYQNMLCRYDTAVLKSLDIFSVHGFPVGLVQCESNLLGIHGESSGPPDLFGAKADSPGAPVGSGGWANIIDKYTKAKAYCAQPFEVRLQENRKTIVPIPGEWIGDSRPDVPEADIRRVDLRCGSATEADLTPGSLDAVLTDPPYFGNVQYAELMDFCYVWLRRLAKTDPAFGSPTTRNLEEMTGNATLERGLSHFAEGVSQVFRRMARALKPGAPLAFTYHHNQIGAYFPIAVGLLDAGFTCTAALPCPAEMAASIHINGTGSSVVDTIFVCRIAGPGGQKSPLPTPGLVATQVVEDLDRLRRGGVEATKGDMRCMIFGHLTRWAVNALRPGWDDTDSVEKRLRACTNWVSRFGGPEAVEVRLAGQCSRPHRRPSRTNRKFET